MLVAWTTLDIILAMGVHATSMALYNYIYSEKSPEEPLMDLSGMKSQVGSLC